MNDGLFSFEGLFTLSSLVSLLTLTALEVGLGFDNVAFMGLEINKLPAEQRGRANRIGMTIAAAMRIVLLGISGFVLSLLTRDLFELFGHGFSGKDVLLFLGGIYLLQHGTRELYLSVEHPHLHEEKKAGAGSSFKEVMRSIAIVNVVFSLDSILTAIGMAKSFWVMSAAVILSVLVMAKFSMVIIEFLSRHLSLKILVISFLFLIGANLCAEAFHQEMNKAFVYTPALFALVLILLTIRAENNRSRLGA